MSCSHPDNDNAMIEKEEKTWDHFSFWHLLQNCLSLVYIQAAAGSRSATPIMAHLDMRNKVALYETQILSEVMDASPTQKLII